jgi:UDP-glucose 4-epimerase
MARIALVTGAHGFIGRHVAKHLAQSGVTVLALGHGNWTRTEWRDWGISDWHAADISLESLMTYGGAPELIFHCAGSGSVAYSVTNPYQDFQRTVSTTLAILEYARLQVPSAKVVLPSSAAVYGHAKRLPTREDDPLAPVSPYGVHKALSEQLCQSYSSHFGLAISIVRLFSVYGIGLRKQLLWDACAKLRQHECSFSGTGDEARDWICVDDAAALLVIASKYVSTACPIANGGSGQCASVKDILQHVAQGLNSRCMPVFSGEHRPGDPAQQLADISVATGWGWSPTVHWRAGVGKYVEWVSEGAV